MEDNREELINWKKGPSKTRVILPLFEKRGTEWILSTSHSEQINWTIAFDGRNRGKSQVFQVQEGMFLPLELMFPPAQVA